ncbi:molybdopterin converting factor subunit 1 [Sphingomonas changnyeongensis]|uniref:Molybdopterin converting factor subunit 1 n=1 Tax=Sphingomonas changnyeongensis TaxID=2698679 RepID=A0A7Z2NXG3_9SPHN|nr:molybdopterin converting factor subunit 1 [Sphingomonas changnyeongensis]QHL91537.1 molybdopterin converting factor subunit 1 [Sphingomonas changnyeongensis]
MVKLLYFAWVRERIGLAEEWCALPPGIADLNGLIDWLVETGPGHAGAFADRSRIRAAIDQQAVPLDTPVTGAAEIAFFPPMTGG